MGAEGRAWRGEDDASVAQLLGLCEANWDALSEHLDNTLAEDVLGDSWALLQKMSTWPTRQQLRACLRDDGTLARPQLLTALRDAGRCFSRAGLGVSGFIEASQALLAQLTHHLVSALDDSAELTRLLCAAQRCAGHATTLMVSESSAEREQELAEGRRQLAEAETKFSGLWESGILGVIVCDFHGNIRQANDGFLKTFGFSRHDLLSGKVRWAEMTPPEWKHLDEQAIEQLTTAGRTRPWEKEYFHRDGSRVPVVVGVSVLNEEETIAFVLDVTERKHVEALRQRSEELATENRRVQEASRLKSEFLANMSHELRTPLNGVIGFAELLLDPDLTPSAEEQREFLGDILNCGLHLQRLINDVLDLAKVEAGKLEFRPEPTDPQRLVEEVCAVLRTVSMQKRISVHSDVDTSLGIIHVDSARLKQVLYNYLSNALKFTDPGGRVDITVRAIDEERFELSVADDGRGIAANDISRLFREFQQLDTGTAKRHPGTGLGLALTKRIVEAQCGSVGVRSEEGKGSTFVAVLPRDMARAPLAEPAPVVDLPDTANRVLVVEDDPADMRLLVHLLSESGYRTTTANSGRQAVASCEENEFDAITLDLLLPDMTGLQVLQQVRNTALNRTTPVVVVSVVAERGVVKGFPVEDYLTKPIDGDALLRSLKRTTPHAAGGQILVIDDDAPSRRLMQATLSAIGYDAVCVADGQAGLEATDTMRPLGVILDLMMPRMDGFEFLTRFRQREANLDVPVVVWTTKDLTSSDRVLLKGLAQSTVMKATSKPDELVEELRRQIERCRSLLQEAGQ